MGQQGFMTPRNHLVSNESLCLSPFGIHVLVDGQIRVTHNSGALMAFWPEGILAEIACVVEKV